MPRAYRLIAGAVCVAVLAGGATAFAGVDDAVRINQIQVIGSHNSYHSGLTPAVGKMIKAQNPKAFDDLDMSEKIFGDAAALKTLVDRHLHCG